MTSASITYQSSQIGYTRTGSGTALVFCLHGFNEEAHSFCIFEKYEQTHSLFAIDLPYHGITKWQEKKLFEPNDLLKIIISILEKEGFDGKSKFTLLGYSLGGRVALSFYQHYPQLVKKLLLMAPDGLHSNIWHWLSVNTYIGNKLFRYTIDYPGWLLRSVGILHRLGIINDGINKFVFLYLGEKHVRELLYKVWTSFRPFKPDIHIIKKIIAKRKTQVQLFFGRYDNIIPIKWGYTFIQGIESSAGLTIIDTGHRLLQKKNIKAYEL